MSKDNSTGWIVVLAAVATITLIARKSSAGKSPMPSLSSDPVDSQLTANFRELEFKHSSNSQLDYQLQRYRLSPVEMTNLRLLAGGLQRARDLVGPITITGGGRPDGLRDKDGRGFYEWLKFQGYDPSSDSQHRNFSAADVTVSSPGARWALFDSLRQDPTFGEVILYIDNAVPSRVHVALRDPNVKPEHLIAEHGRYRPAPPIDNSNRLVSLP